MMAKVEKVSLVLTYISDGVISNCLANNSCLLKQLYATFCPILTANCVYNNSSCTKSGRPFLLGEGMWGFILKQNHRHQG